MVTTALNRNDDDEDEEEEANEEEHRTLRRIVGKSQFLVPRRPDIAFATNRLARSLARPSKNRPHCVETSLCDTLCGTMDFGLKLQVQNRACSTLSVFSDSHWAGDRPTRKSVSSWVIMLDGFLLSAGARSQSVVAESSCEAECVAATAATSEAKCLEALFSACGRHVSIQVRSANKTVRISKVPGLENVADANTKPADRRSLEFCRSSVGVTEIPKQLRDTVL